MTVEEFEDMVKKNFSWIEREAARICGMAHAPDAVQEACAELSRRLPGLQLPGHAVLRRRAIERAKDIRRLSFHVNHGSITDDSKPTEIAVGSLDDLSKIPISRSETSVWETKKAPGGRKPKAQRPKPLLGISAADFEYDRQWLLQARTHEQHRLRSIVHCGEMGQAYCIFGPVEIPR